MDGCSRELRSTAGDGISLSGIGSFASFVVPEKNLKLDFQFRSAHANGKLFQLPLLIGSGTVNLDLRNYRLKLSLVENQSESWSDELVCRRTKGGEWNHVTLVLKNGHKPALECNKQSKEISITDRNMDLSGLVNFGNSVKIGRSNSGIPSEICFKSIKINDSPQKVPGQNGSLTSTSGYLAFPNTLLDLRTVCEALIKGW